MGSDKLETTTLLYFDMVICMEFLHCTHGDFLKLSRLEKNKCRYFLSVKGQKEQNEVDRSNTKPQDDLTELQGRV